MSPFSKKSVHVAISTKLEKELPPKRGERLIGRSDVLSACRYDAEATRIIETSSFTTHNRVGLHRHVRIGNILNDFFEPEDFRGKTILELGPGHYSFAMVARHLGARVICVERYEPHVALGRHLGFEVLDMDFRDVTPEAVGAPVDGLFMKGAFNACAFKDEEGIDEFVRGLTALMGPEAWGWCVTVNKAGGDESKEAFVDERIGAQRRAFKRHGWRATPIDEADRKRYAVSYAGARFYFTRNLALVEADRARRARREARAPAPRRGETLLAHHAALEAAGLDDAALALALRSSNGYAAGRCLRTANIINDFFTAREFRGRRILELGPGQYAFALLARHLGADVACVECNPDIAALGRHLGFHVIESNFLDIDLADIGGPVEGLWLKGAFRVSGKLDATKITAFTARLTSWIGPDGWGWCVPDNRPEAAAPGSPLRPLIEVQREAFIANGWDSPPLRDEDRDRYALKRPFYGGTQNYFTRRLPLALDG